MKKISVSSSDAGQKLIPFLRKVLPLAPLSFFYKMMRRKNITVNDLKVHGKEVLHTGDSICFWLSDETFQKFSSSKPMAAGSGDFSSLVIYEDDDFLIGVKPAGMLSQGDHSSRVSFNDLLLQHAAGNSYTKPSIANRLDRNTSGILLCGKTVRGLQYLAKLLKDRSLTKSYLLIACGQLKKDGSFRSYFSKDERRNQAILSNTPSSASDALIQTDYKLLQSAVYDQHPVSFGLAHLITGKTHQIRAQFAFNGAPLLGDPKYRSKASEQLSRALSIHRQMLHAYSVQFPVNAKFPSVSGKTFYAPLPHDFQTAFKKLSIDFKYELSK